MYRRSVWVEEASSPGCLNCLLHDLDLLVTLGGTSHYPNNLGKPDRQNNAERVVINGVQNEEVATITVTAHNLARYEQKYSLVATGCFGGVANQLYANGECSVFECDNSKSKRTAIILSAIFVPLGVILFGIIGNKMTKKKREREHQFEDHKHVEDHPNSRGYIEEGISVIDENSAGGNHSGLADSNLSGHHQNQRSITPQDNNEL